METAIAANYAWWPLISQPGTELRHTLFLQMFFLMACGSWDHVRGSNGYSEGPCTTVSQILRGLRRNRGCFLRDLNQVLGNPLVRPVRLEQV